MMGAAPRVSVVIPTCNRLPFLKEAIASVRDQTFPDWELLVVDDGSTDGTVEWVEGLNDPRIRAVALDHCGDIAALRNEGIRRARARHVAFLDSDDLWMRRKIELQLQALAASEDARWSYTAVRRMDRAGNEVSDRGIQPWRACSGWILPELLTMKALVATPTLLAERDLLLDLGGLDSECGSYVTDFDLVFRMGLESPAVAVDRPLAWVRIHEGAHSRDRVAAHRGWSRLYERLGPRMPTASLRRTCERRALRHRLILATLLGRAGRGREAVGAVTSVLRRRPWMPRAWWVLARHVLPWGGPATPRSGDPTEALDD